MDEQSRPRGRPREAATDERIVAAALELLAAQGYNRMSVDQVALHAGVTKPTIYRRYPRKIDLALAAIRAYCDLEPVAECGETRADLLAQLNQLRYALDRPNGMSMIGTMLAEEHETPELLASFREHLVVPRRMAIRAILERAAARGEFPPEANLAIGGTLFVGAYYAHYLGGAPFPANWSEAVVDHVLAALAWRTPA